MSNIIVFANQKGGVGKTTSIVNIATVLAASNFNVLLIDLDPQANASSALCGNSTLLNNEINSYELLLGKKLAGDFIKQTFIPNLSIVYSHVNLVGAEVELVNFVNREKILHNKLLEVHSQFDYILIDCPPSMGLLTLNAFVASKSVIVPLQCEYYALEGLSYLLKSIQKIKQNFNDEINILGVLLTMFDKRSRLSMQVANDAKTHLKQLVFNTIIPRSVKIAEAPSHGKPGIIYDIKSSGAIAYIEVTKEIINRTRI
jgi:chromosome partitioning protein